MTLYGLEKHPPPVNALAPFPRLHLLLLLLTPQRRGRAEASEQQAEAGADSKLHRWVFSPIPDVSRPAVDSSLVPLRHVSRIPLSCLLLPRVASSNPRVELWTVSAQRWLLARLG